MDLKMEVYSPGLELLGVLEVHQSILWENKAFSCGSFSLESLITDESRALLIPENILWIEGDAAGIIEYVQRQAGADGPYITAKGRDLTGILDRRILWGTYDLYGPVPDLMRQLVDDCCIHPTRGQTEARVIPGLVLEGAAPAAGEKIRKQQTGGSLLEALEELGEAYQVAFGVRFNPEVPRMEFWTRYGADRSTGQTNNDPVFYSTELDDVLASEYSYDSSNYRNITLVAGEGEGTDRVTVTVENPVEEEPQPPVTTECTITLSIDPAGGGVVTGGGTVQSGASVTVTAAPSSGYVFSGWRENGAIVSSESSYTFQANGDRSLTAVFAADITRYTISTSVDPAGAGTVSGGGTFEDGQSVTLTASAADGYEFAAWRENGSNVSTSATYTLTASANRAITAVFTVIPSYTVTASIDPSGAGTVTGTGTYRRGTSVTVTAVPADSYTFSGWKNGSTTVSTNASYTFTVTANVALTAAFAKASRLPAGYTELEYVQSSDTTTVSSASSIVFPSVANAAACYCKFSINSNLVTSGTVTSEFMLFGYQYRNASNLCQLYSLALYNSNIVMWQRYYKSSNVVRSPVTLAPQALNTIYEFYSNSSTQKTTLNGDVVSGYIYPTFYGKGTSHVCNVLFGQCYTSGTDVSNTAVKGIRIYEFKMMDENDGVLLHLIPCKDSSGKIGMYDIIGKVFYANAKGTFLSASTAPGSVTVNTSYPLIAGPAV